MSKLLFITDTYRLGLNFVFLTENIIGADSSDIYFDKYAKNEVWLSHVIVANATYIISAHCILS